MRPFTGNFMGWIWGATCPLLATAAQAGQGAAAHWTPAPISSNQYEATPTFTPGGREMFFMLSNPKFEGYRILWTRCVDGAWTQPAPPPFAAPESVMEADPFVTADGKRLYFISERVHPQRARQRDDFDIWYVDRAADGSWQPPQRLPDPVNSTGGELLPRMSADGRLYFGSDRTGGFGARDIYVATSNAEGRWQVSNVGPPVSTAASEYEAEVSRDGRTLIVVADRGDKSHLYRYVNIDGRWVERERIPARPDVFQVGPLLSPMADRLLFAQADGERSGEMFLIDLKAEPDPTWPPRCSGDPAVKR